MNRIKEANETGRNKSATTQKKKTAVTRRKMFQIKTLPTDVTARTTHKLKSTFKNQNKN